MQAILYLEQTWKRFLLGWLKPLVKEATSSLLLPFIVVNSGTAFPVHCLHSLCWSLDCFFFVHHHLLGSILFIVAEEDGCFKCLLSLFFIYFFWIRQNQFLQFSFIVLNLFSIFLPPCMFHADFQKYSLVFWIPCSAVTFCFILSISQANEEITLQMCNECCQQALHSNTFRRDVSFSFFFFNEHGFERYPCTWDIKLRFINGLINFGERG